MTQKLVYYGKNRKMIFSRIWITQACSQDTGHDVTVEGLPDGRLFCLDNCDEKILFQGATEAELSDEFMVWLGDKSPF